MNIAKGLEILELSTISTGREGVIHPVLLWDDTSVILIDAGLPGQWPLIKEKIIAAGLLPERLSKVILTHHDLDHMGSLKELQNELGNRVKTIAHKAEKPYIEFEKPPQKMSPEKAEELKPAIQSKVDEVICHGQWLEECGGIIVLHTPGHTPGHISLYLKQYKILVAGDALNILDGVLMGPHPRQSDHLEQAQASLKVLLQYDIEAVICYHGGFYEGDIIKQISMLSQ